MQDILICSMEQFTSRDSSFHAKTAMSRYCCSSLSHFLHEGTFWRLRCSRRGQFHPWILVTVTTGSYTINNFDGSGIDVVITVTNIETSSSPGYAEFEISGRSFGLNKRIRTGDRVKSGRFTNGNIPERFPQKVVSNECWKERD